MPVAWAVGACGGPSGRAEERRSGVGDLGRSNRAGEADRKETRRLMNVGGASTPDKALSGRSSRQVTETTPIARG
jgi:hypothetical protein